MREEADAIFKIVCIWIFFLIQVYFTFWYSFTLYEEVKYTIKEPSTKLLVLLVLQVFLTCLILPCVLCWTRMVLTPSRTMTMVLLIILLLSHVRHGIAAFYHYTPLQYMKNHGSFWVTIALLIVILFYPTIPRFIAARQWETIVLFFIGVTAQAVMKKKNHVLFLCSWAILVLWMSSWFLKEKKNKKKTGMIATLITISIVLGIVQVMIQYQARKEMTIIEMTRDRSLRSLTPMAILLAVQKLNVLAEYIMIQEMSPRLDKRPIMTPYLSEFFRKNKKSPTDVSLKDAVSSLYPHNILHFLPLEYGGNKKKKNYVGYVAQVAPHQFDIVMRGTITTEEWVGNLGGATRITKGKDDMHLHAEIALESSYLASTAMKWIMQKTQPHSRILISMYGHSRGSTIATYMMMDIKTFYPTNISMNLYLFAPPPLLDPMLSSSLTTHRSTDPKNATSVHVTTIIHENDILESANKFIPISNNRLGRLHRLRGDFSNAKKKPYPFLQLSKDRRYYKTVNRRFQPTNKMIFHYISDYMFLAQQEVEHSTQK